MGSERGDTLTPPQCGCERTLRGVRCRWRAVVYRRRLWLCSVCAEQDEIRRALARARRKKPRGPVR